MKAVTVSEIGSFSYGERSVPRPAAGEVLVQVALAGLCRTDLKIIRSGHRDLLLPRIPGEEVVGTVVERGAGVEIPVGTRVYVYPGMWCGCCRQCRAGAENLCREMRIMGFHRDGGFAEYVTVPEQSLIPLPGQCSFADAVFAEPLSCCINALEQARLSPGERIGIWGAGPAGTLLQRLATVLGAEATVIEPDPRRRELVGGISVPGERHFDVCIPAVGSHDAYREALAHLAPRGRLVVFSGLPKESQSPEVCLNSLHYLEQTISGAYGCCFRHGRLALEMITDGSLRVVGLVSHTMPLSELDQALQMVEQRSCMKIHLDPRR
ncbi:MAG: alcohol dehydrogenase catalytic domain-containing protein [Desulfuromonadales bacterium]